MGTLEVWHCPNCLESWTADRNLDGIAHREAAVQDHVLSNRACRVALAAHVPEATALTLALTSVDECLIKVVREFSDDHPQTQVPERVMDLCLDYSIEFQRPLMEQGLPGVGLMSGMRTLDDDPHALMTALYSKEELGLGEGTVLVTGGHFATAVDGLVIDWTYRQFEPDSMVPRVITEDQWRKEWSIASRDE